MKLVSSLVIVLGIAIGLFVGKILYSATNEIKNLPSQETIGYLYYVPNEPAQDKLLKAQGWTSVLQMISYDLSFPLEKILVANGLNKTQPIKSGSYITIPVGSGYSFEACASFYGLNDGFDNNYQADGSIFRADNISLASKELPKGSIVTVEFLETGVMVKGVKVKDSGPYYATCKKYPNLPRAIDLSWGLMKKGFQENVVKAKSTGITRVKITINSIPEKYISHSHNLTTR